MPNRPAVDMTRADFIRALEWATFYVKKGTQVELNLAGIGESTIHPEFVDFVRLAREAVGWKVKLIFATNGIEHDEKMIQAITPYRPNVWVSLHRPEKAAKALELYRKYGILDGASIDPSVNANNWAGQVDWHVSGEPMKCQWLRTGKVMVMADGRITTCCLDATGSGIVGTVHDPIDSLQIKPYDLCKNCHQEIGSRHWNQKEGVAL